MTDRLEFHCDGDGGTQVQAEKRLTYQTEGDARRAEGLNEDNATVEAGHGGQ